MLRLVEEIMLLLIDDEDGEFVHVPEWPRQCALAGAVLMELALENRIDTDLEHLVLIDSTPLQDNLLDPTLALIAEAKDMRDARYWVEQVSQCADEIQECTLARLVERGILRQKDQRFLWVFQSRRYPMIDGKAERDVKLRIMGVLFSDEIPEPRDIIIICLADACGILVELLPERELRQVYARVAQVNKMDLIGRAVSNVVRDIEASLILNLHPTF